MKYYTKEGYIDFDGLLQEDRSVLKFIVGARGIGKTFGALKYMMDHRHKFIFMRRTQTQIDLIKTDDLNPFKSLARVCGDSYLVAMQTVNKYVTGIYKVDVGDKDLRPIGAPIGYMMALSTISNIRGFDASDVEYVIYDEFIGEKHEKSISSEGTAFLNALETIGRNRELEGFQPLQVIAMSNSTNLANPIFIELQIITKIEKLLKKGNDVIRLPDRDMSIYVLKDSPISKKKAKTSLYRIAGTDSDFAQMALSNQFNKEFFGQVKSRKLAEFRPLVSVGELMIYKHKSRREWYVTDTEAGRPERYDSSDIELERFRNDYYYLKLAYLNRHVFFMSYIQQVLFERYLKIM